jgi:hypothetical protein
MKTILTFAALAVAFTATHTNAQTVDYAAEGAAPNVAVTGYYGGGFYPGWGYGGGTVEGSVLRGAADLVRAEGDNAYMNSLANINNQIAIKKNIENRDQWVETYFHMRRTNDAYRASQRLAPSSLDKSQQMARMMTPQRLNSYQLDPATGKIHWPAAFQGTEFTFARQQLEKMFTARSAQNAGVGGTLDSSVNAITGQMREALKSQINNMPTSEYLAAKKFIDGLGYEARFAPGVEGLAAN